MDEAKFEELLALGHEIAGVEFKGPGRRDDKAFAAVVVRACLGMANRRDGGTVILGVIEESATLLKPGGLPAQQADSWGYDEVAELLASYADPSISLNVERFSYQGAIFIIITVREFENIPILCRKDFTDGPRSRQTLRKGACYVRTRRKPETTEIATSEDMRDLLDLAIEKGIRRWIALNTRVGLSQTGISNAPPSDAAKFDNQIRDLTG